MLRKNDSVFASRMKHYMEEHMHCSYFGLSCAEEVKPMLKKFVTESILTDVDWKKGSHVCWHIERVAEAASNFVCNTRNHEPMTMEEVAICEKIFAEYAALREEAIQLDEDSEYHDELRAKISCISEMTVKNFVGMHDSEEEHEMWRDGMIFQNYEDFWKIIHRVNTEWDELRSRGFSLNVFYNFWDAFKCRRSFEMIMTEENKVSDFMAVLDGTKKLVPVYVHHYTPVGFDVVEKKEDDEVIITSDKKTKKSCCMKEANVTE